MDKIPYKECQDNEFFSITAIFPDEVTDLRKQTKSAKWKPLEMEIQVFPEESMTSDNGRNTQIDLYVKCSENYPDASPFIDIKKSKGISNQNLAILKSELQAKAKELVGREMILELVYHSRSFLYSHKQPHYDSFFDEMVCNNLKKQQLEAERLAKQKQELENLEQQKKLAIEQEKQRKIEALRDANKRTRFVDDNTTNHLNPSVEFRGRRTSTSRQRSRSTSISKENCSADTDLQPECKEVFNTKLKFVGKKEFNVNCGRCLGHNERGCVTYYGMDSGSGVPIVVIKWTLHFNVSHKLKGEEWEALQKEQANYLKQIAAIEQEFKNLRNASFKHLVNYLGMIYFSRKDKIIIYVLQEYVSGCNFALIYKDIRPTIPQLQHYSREILKSLKYLHENSIVHKNLRSSSLFLDNSGIIRVADFSLDKKLYDLYRSLTKEEEIDVYPPTIGKGGKKSDIYRLGVILLSFLLEELPKTSPVIIPEYLNPTFKDFLNKCLLHDEQERWSAEQLLSHPFLAHQSVCGMLPKDIEMNDDIEDDSMNILLSDEGIQGSRLRNEFDVLKVLGRGGFGHVWKVKNKLDARVYALKRIPLNPSNKQLNRKIKREVKLLSRLNHENIVRYYNSWIEATPEVERNLDVLNDKSSEKEMDVVDSLGAQFSSSVQWEIHDKDLSSSEDECEDDDFIVFLSDNSDSNEKGNEKHANANSDDSSTIEQVTTDSDSSKSTSKVRQFMYIQMEFCEKSTLRTAIDNGLHNDVSLVWRLFREIVEGLHHIHQQGVIHRDLKPVNIFLDSKDHVKIGDFGLATDVISKPFLGDINFSDQDQQSRSELGDGTQTGNVGTAFYVAPELATSFKVSYSQKVDIYSLGIIFFEMCYPPPVTAMERNVIISNLRHRDIVFPAKASEMLTEEMLQIIKWLLQHDVTKRPSSNELITSKYIPPLLMEETELNSLLYTTVSNPQSRMYKHMINALFDQEVSTEFDFTYDIDVFRSPSLKNKPNQLFSNVMDTLNKIMRLHGAVYFSVPTLMPKSSVIENENCVHVMEHGGGMVMLPYNLRIPFARYIARKEIDFFRRYSLEKVFRQQKVFGCHPREQYEFSFDIVTPTPDSFLPDAEVLSAISEIISEFTSLESRNYYIRLNHALLLKAIFLYSEIDESLENEIYEIAGQQKNKTITKALLMDEHNSFELNQRSLSRLSQFIEIEEGIEKMTNVLHPVMQKKGKACMLARSCLKELENIINLAQTLSIKLPILVCPGLVHNITSFSGMLFQCVCKLKTSKRKGNIDILAVGGRYDKLIGSFKLKVETGKSLNQSAVGVSIAIESIVAAELEANVSQEPGVADFLIHSEDSGLAVEKASLLKELWDLGIRGTVLYDKNMTFDDAADFCRNHGIQHILFIRKEEPGIIKIRSIERDRVYEKKIIHSELKEQLLKLCSKSQQENSLVKIECSRSTSFTNCSSNNLLVNVRFLPQDKTHANRKREQNIRTHVISTLQLSSSRVWELVPVDLKMAVVGTIISVCDISANVDSIQRSFDVIIDEFTKYKKYLSQLCEEICDIKAKKSGCAIVIYSLPDNNFKVLL
ncbi:eIF-2-alpha kinase GCN2-like [Uloborus diversus]|uniref:eIF-2-alpha kinase GCN2-like n=1 Tax=Uloborus diversus TaxID=327109 RepID=UPI00240A1AC2|nr:eIF-2-alpha kinase GCN2-like [Uloborus diversus]